VNFSYRHSFFKIENLEVKGWKDEEADEDEDEEVHDTPLRSETPKVKAFVTRISKLLLFNYYFEIYFSFIVLNTIKELNLNTHIIRKYLLSVQWNMQCLQHSRISWD
jgi:hypothetical protein